MKMRTSLPTLVAFICLGWMSTARVVGQIITNGGFEAGNFSGWSLLSDPQSFAHTLVRTATTPTDIGIAPFEGSYFGTFSNNSPLASGFTQTFSTVSGQSYALSYWFTTTIGSDILNELKVTWNGGVLIDSVGFASLGTVWTNTTFLVTGTGSDTITFSGYQNSGWNGLDAVSLTAVPERSTYAALLGLTALGIARWRRRRS